MSRFIELLKKHEIEVVADVRSKPYAGYAVHFKKANLIKQLKKAGLKYVFLGRELGGRPEEPEFYIQEKVPNRRGKERYGEKVYYGRLVTTPRFREGIVRLFEGTLRWKVALMCSEEDPTNCHRRRLITWALKLDSQHEPTTQWRTPAYEVIPEQHVQWLKTTLSGLSLDDPTVLVHHIRGNGDVIEEQDLRDIEAKIEAQRPHQLQLLQDEERDERWKSAHYIQDDDEIDEQEFHEAEDEENSPHQLGFLEDEDN